MSQLIKHFHLIRQTVQFASSNSLVYFIKVQWQNNVYNGVLVSSFMYFDRHIPP